MSVPKRTGPAEGAGRSPGRDTLERTAPTLFGEEAERPWTHQLHDLDGLRRAREEAALEAVSSWWRAEAEAALERLAASGQPFDAERLRGEVGDAPGPSQNAFGALFAAASRAGTIRCIGTRTASRDVAAGHMLRVWIGTEVDV